MARPCDAGTCQAKATMIGSYTAERSENKTKAACSHEHRRIIDHDLLAQHFVATWKPFVQPEERRRQETGADV